jgi:hypothetical protein
VIAGSAFFVWGIEREAVNGPARKGRRAPAALEEVVGLPSRIDVRGKRRPYKFAGIARQGWVAL